MTLSKHNGLYYNKTKQQTKQTSTYQRQQGKYYHKSCCLQLLSSRARNSSPGTVVQYSFFTCIFLHIQLLFNTRSLSLDNKRKKICLSFFVSVSLRAVWHSESHPNVAGLLWTNLELADKKIGITLRRIALCFSFFDFLNIHYDNSVPPTLEQLASNKPTKRSDPIDPQPNPNPKPNASSVISWFAITRLSAVEPTSGLFSSAPFPSTCLSPIAYYLVYALVSSMRQIVEKMLNVKKKNKICLPKMYRWTRARK